MDWLITSVGPVAVSAQAAAYPGRDRILALGAPSDPSALRGIGVRRLSLRDDTNVAARLDLSENRLGTLPGFGDGRLGRHAALRIARDLDGDSAQEAQLRNRDLFRPRRIDGGLVDSHTLLRSELGNEKNVDQVGGQLAAEILACGAELLQHRVGFVVRERSRRNTGTDACGLKLQTKRLDLSPGLRLADADRRAVHLDGRCEVVAPPADRQDAREKQGRERDGAQEGEIRQQGLV